MSLSTLITSNHFYVQYIVPMCHSPSSLSSSLDKFCSHIYCLLYNCLKMADQRRAYHINKVIVLVKSDMMLLAACLPRSLSHLSSHSVMEGMVTSSPDADKLDVYVLVYCIGFVCMHTLPVGHRST